MLPAIAVIARLLPLLLPPLERLAIRVSTGARLAMPLLLLHSACRCEHTRRASWSVRAPLHGASCIVPKDRGM